MLKATTDIGVAARPAYDKKQPTGKYFITDVHCHVLDGSVRAPLHDAPNLRSGNVVCAADGCLVDLVPRLFLRFGYFDIRPNVLPDDIGAVDGF